VGAVETGRDRECSSRRTAAQASLTNCGTATRLAGLVEASTLGATDAEAKWVIDGTAAVFGATVGAAALRSVCTSAVPVVTLVALGSAMFRPVLVGRGRATAFVVMAVMASPDLRVAVGPGCWELAVEDTDLGGVVRGVLWRVV
jgi:hypothetical protein